MFINTVTHEHPVGWRTIRAKHPNTSLPRRPDDGLLAALGYARIHPTPRPAGDVVTEGAPEPDSDGVWHQAWQVRDYTEEEQAERAAQQHEALLRELSRVHDAYSNGTTPHRGIDIAIDVEARVNARGTLDAVKGGIHPLPFKWFRGDASIAVESVEDMQAIHDAIFHALRRGFEAKAKVLASLDSITDPAGYNVASAFRAHL